MWRPQTFHDLIGQPHVKQTLVNALSRNVVAHAYLFCGPRGTGKTSAAKILAKAVNCLQPKADGEPCNQCEACTSITRGNGMDVEEIDAASNRGVDEIRQLRDKVQYAPTGLKRKVYIIDEVHMLTTEAFNALLKTLEEPPAHTLFVLATTEPHKIPGTIISRCQRFDFRRIAPELMMQRLQEVCTAQSWTAQEEALWKIAQTADGGLRDALGLLEQTAAFGGGEITTENAAHVMGGVESHLLLQLVSAVRTQDVAIALNLLGQWYESGKDAVRIVHELLQVFRDLVIVKMSTPDSLPGHLQRSDLQTASQTLPIPWLMEGVKRLGETYANLRYLDDPRLALEASLLMLVPEDSSVSMPPQSTQAGNGVSGRPASQGTTPRSAIPKSGQDSAAPVTEGLKSGQDSAAPVTEGPKSGQDSAASVTAGPKSGDGSETANSTQDKERAKRASGKAAESRKKEALQRLLEAADDAALGEVKRQWDSVLQTVKDRRVQTHAWLMNGEAMLATGTVIVLAFSSRFHRDTVMKTEERSVIEQALSDALGAPQQMLALLREDWEKYGQADSEPEVDEEDLAATAVKVFGKDLVEIIDGE